MGISSKKSSSKTKQTTTMTSTPTNPGFTTDLIGGLAGKIGKTFDAIDPYSLVTGANPLQQQAAASAANLGFGGGNMPMAPKNPTDGKGKMAGGFAGTSPAEGRVGGGFDPYAASMKTLQDVSRAGPQSVDGVSIAGGINSFLDPYLKDVVDTSLVNYDEGAGFTRAENKLALAGDDTFGGSGGAIQTALSERGLADDRGRLAAELRSGGYDRAAALSGQQAGLDQQANLANASFGEAALNRQQAAALGLADVGGAQQGNERANIATQAGLGGSLRDIDQAKARAPIDMLLQQIAAAGGLPLDLFKGTDAKGSLKGKSSSKESGAALGDWLNLFAANASGS